MPISANAKYKVPPDVLINVIEGQSVLLNLKTERYFGLDEVGTAMWHALTTSPNLDAACDQLLDEFEVAPERLRNDLADLAAQLVNEGLLEVRGG